MARTADNYVVVGGRERSVGGWSGYEIDARAARACTGGGDYYAGRSYVSSEDVVSSLLAARPTGGAAAAHRHALPSAKSPALSTHEAARRLMNVIGTIAARAAQPSWWDSHAGLSLPGEDLGGEVELLQSQPCDVQNLRAVLDTAAFMLEANAVERPPVLPEQLGPASLGRLAAARAQLTSEPVSTTDSAGLRLLEEGCRSYAGQLEICQAHATAYIGSAAGRLERWLEGNNN